LKFTGLVPTRAVWETVGMAKHTPKPNDIVFMNGKGFIRYLVVSVNSHKQTADVKGVAGPIVLTHDVPWSKLQLLDESQNALRIVREATEGK
jgi:hypothetical protein